MKTEHVSPTQAVENSLWQLRNMFLQNVAIALLLLAIFAAPASISRGIEFGWLPIHVIHLMLSVLVISAFTFRKKLKNSLLLAYAIIIFSAISLAGFVQYGIMSAGFYAALASIFVAMMGGGKRIAIYTSCIWVALISVISSFWSSGRLTFPDAAIHMSGISTWASHITTFICIIVIFAFAASNFITSLRMLLNKLLEQKSELQQQKVIIEHLANHDILTGLPTLRLADDRLNMAIDSAKRHNKKLSYSI